MSHGFDALRILRGALDLDGEAREAFVVASCGGDAVLLDEVRGLLAEARRVESEDIDSQPAVEDCADPLVGTMLGSFRIAARIGRGGMGVVYLGEREGADFTQTVAVKVVRRGFDFDEVRARFLRERRILAALSHPNLARFIDGGVAVDGRPWFALEFVHGEAITRWCDAHRLDVRARVTLFIEACAAVQHAHARLVVHRDLKPANMLVDERGSVRLLDFGVAGLIADDGDDASPATIGLARAMTPEYAAPEQLARGQVGIQADVYALGVVLFELVAGVLPYDFGARDIDTAARVVGGTPPPSPAVAITRAAKDGQGDAVAQRLAARRTSLRSFQRSVRGDLARILDKALAREVVHRYATVAEFADDLARWLHGEPVRAAGRPFGYRLGTFVRRHRVAVGLAVAAVVSLAAFAGYHAARLSAQLESTEAQRNRAEASLAFLQNLLASPDPALGVGSETTLGTFLGHAARAVADSDQLAPDIRDELAVTVAGSLKSIDRYDDALAIAREVASRAAATPGERTTRLRARTLVGEILTLTGRYDEAVAELATASAQAEAEHVADPLVLAELYSAQSIVHNHIGQWDASIGFIDRAIAVAKPVREALPKFYANLLGFASIPRAYPKTDLPGAERFLRESLAFQRERDLADTGLYASTLGELAQVLIDQGRFEDAGPMLEDVVVKMQKHFGAEHRETSFKMTGLALLYFRWHRFDEARVWRDRANAAMRTALGAEHPFVALGLVQSADLAFQAGDLRRAAEDAAAAVPIADAQDKDEFSTRAALYGDARACAGGDRDAVARLVARNTALGDAFGIRAFDVRLATARCLLHVGRRDEALAVIDALDAPRRAGKPLSRNDYVVPAIEAVRRAAGAP